MARNIDLTGKLGLAGKPTITIGDMVLEVNDGAAGMLRMMALMGDDGEMAVADMAEAAEILFGKKGMAAIEKAGLSFADFSQVLEAALELAAGGAEGESEATQATT